MSTNELAIPEPTDIAPIVPVGFAKQVRVQVEEWSDFDTISEARRRLAALEKYVKDKASQFEVQAGSRWAETRIGELLEEPVQGRHISSDRDRMIAEDDRRLFRLLAANVPIIEECIEEKHKASRKFILDEIRKRTQGDPMPSAPTIELANAIQWLPRQPYADLLLTDPPYSTDVADIGQFAQAWLPVALEHVKPTGRAYVCIGAYPQELKAYLDVPTEPFQLANILVWTYRNTLGPTPSHDYKLNWQAILYYYGPEAPPLNSPVMVEQFAVQDINAPDGRQGDRWFKWQKPDALAERFIRHSTEEGDVVLDPFAGSGSFLLAAGRLGRLGRGCELDPQVLDIAVERGCGLVV